MGKPIISREEYYAYHRVHGNNPIPYEEWLALGDHVGFPHRRTFRWLFAPAVILLGLAVFCLSGCAMSPSEKAWQTLHFLDVSQTINGAASDDPCWREKGIPTKYLIGDKPKPEAVIAWGVGLSVLHYYASRWLDNSDLPDGAKTVIRSIDIGNQAVIVAQNHNEGARPWGDNARSCL